ncbi:MAG: FAD-dependent oxidoreductase, partial [Dehalococcoidia bacterium]
MHHAFDLAVVGGGLAGLTAANRCAEAGLSVAVLERGEAADYRCNSRFAMGFMTVARENLCSEPEV